MFVILIEKLEWGRGLYSRLWIKDLLLFFKKYILHLFLPLHRYILIKLFWPSTKESWESENPRLHHRITVPRFPWEEGMTIKSVNVYKYADILLCPGSKFASVSYLTFWFSRSSFSQAQNSQGPRCLSVKNSLLCPTFSSLAPAESMEAGNDVSLLGQLNMPEDCDEENLHWPWPALDCLTTATGLPK